MNKWSEYTVHVPVEMKQWDHILTWSEVQVALHKLSSGKCGGMDDVAPEILKMALQHHPTNLSTTLTLPQSNFAKALWTALANVWNSGRIPQSWTTSLVVPIRKKGDPTVMDNYRGISLISVLGKVLSLVILGKLNYFVEKRQLLVREQAGFRTKEECVGQVIALYEIQRRREILSLPTFALFIDLRKAYDSVPHQALMVKLLNAGVDGWCFQLITGPVQ